MDKIPESVIAKALCEGRESCPFRSGGDGYRAGCCMQCATIAAELATHKAPLALAAALAGPDHVVVPRAIAERAAVRMIEPRPLIIEDR